MRAPWEIVWDPEDAPELWRHTISPAADSSIFFGVNRGDRYSLVVEALKEDDGMWICILRSGPWTFPMRPEVLDLKVPAEMLAGARRWRLICELE